MDGWRTLNEDTDQRSVKTFGLAYPLRFWFCKGWGWFSLASSFAVQGNQEVQISVTRYVFQLFRHKEAEPTLCEQQSSKGRPPSFY